jgi:hypothetical protein
VTAVDLLAPASRMQLSKSHELFSVQKLLWSSVGVTEAAHPADLQKADVQSCLAAARAVCLQRVSCCVHLLWCFFAKQTVAFVLGLSAAHIACSKGGTVQLLPVLKQHQQQQ